MADVRRLIVVTPPRERDGVHFNHQIMSIMDDRILALPAELAGCSQQGQPGNARSSGWDLIGLLVVTMNPPALGTSLIAGVVLTQAWARTCAVR